MMRINESQLESLLKEVNIQPSNEWKSSTYEMLLDLEKENKGYVFLSNIRQALSGMNIIYAVPSIVLATIMTFSALSSGVQYSNKSVPGDRFYTTDLIIEDIQRSFATSRLNLELDIIKERNSELDHLIYHKSEDESFDIDTKVIIFEEQYSSDLAIFESLDIDKSSGNASEYKIMKNIIDKKLKKVKGLDEEVINKDNIETDTADSLYNTDENSQNIEGVNDTNLSGVQDSTGDEKATKRKAYGLEDDVPPKKN